MAQLLSEEDFADSTTNPNAMLLSESDFADSSDALRKRLRLKDSLLNKIGYVKNRTKEDKPDAEGLTLDDYRNFVTSSDFNTLDEERLNLVAQAVDAKHADVSKKRGFGRIIMDAGARGFQRAVDMDRASNFVGKKVDQESRDARQALVDVEDETEIAHPRSVGSVKNIRGVGDAVTMAAESMAENLPNMLIPIASSIAGAKAGGAIGATAGPAGALAGATIGAMGGGFLGGLRMNVGEAVMDQTREGLELNRGLALGQGVGYSLLDMGGAEVAAARRIARGTLAVHLREAKKDFVATIAKAAKTIRKDMFREGWTEAAQSGVVGNTRRKMQTGSFVELGKTPGDLVWNALDEAYGGAFAGGGMSMVTTGYQYAGNKKMVKHADAEISRMAQDTDIAKLDPYDRVILAKMRVNMAVRADVESSLSDIEGTRKQMVDDFLASKQAQKMTETERNSHIDKNMSSDAIRENLTKTIESIDKYDVEARDTLGGTAKTVLNAYESEFSNMSIDDVPVDYKSDFDSSEIVGMRDSKIVEPDGSETYKGPKTDIMIEGRPGAYSIRNNNGMKMPIGESGVVDTLEEAVAFASKLARFNQYRIDNNASKAEFIKGVAEKSHPGATVKLIDTPEQAPEGVRKRFIGGGEQGFYNPGDNTVYMMLDAVQNPAQAEIILAHEDTHRGLMDVLKKGGLIEEGETVDEAKQRLFGADNSSDAAKSEEQIARTGEQWQGNRGKLAKMRDTMQAWLYQKTGTRTVIGNADVRLWLDTIEQVSKTAEGGKVEYQPEGQSDANKIRYENAKNGRLTLEEEAQRQNDAAPVEPSSQRRVINRDTNRAGLIAGMNQQTKPDVVVSETPVGETDVIERRTRHRVFEGGSPITIKGENVLPANNDSSAYRLTGQDQIDDMIASGEVRAKNGKMRGGRSGETQWSRGDKSLGYRASSNDGRYVIETTADGLNDREGGLPLSEVTKIHKSVDGKWVDVTEQIKPHTTSSVTSPVVDTRTHVGDTQAPLLSADEMQQSLATDKPSSVRDFVKTELRIDRIKEKHGELFNQAMDVTDGDEQAATGLVSEWLAGQNIADKSVPDSVRVASKLEQKADLTAKDADTLEQNAVFGKDLFLFGYRKDKQTGSWKFQETVQQPAQDAPQSTPVEPVASEPDIGTLQWYESELVSQRTRLRVKQRDWSKANKLSKEPKPETDNPFTSELYDVEKTLRQTRQSIYKADQSLKPVFGEKTEKESFKAFFEAMNQTGEFDLLQHWHEGRGLFSSPKKGSGGEYDAYRSLSKTMRKMIVWKSKQSIDQAAGEIAGLPWGKPEYGDSSVGPEMLVSDWVYQYNAYQQWKAEGSPSRSDIEGKRYEAEHRQEQEDLATYKQKVDNGEVIADGSFIAVRTGADTVRMAGVDPEWPIVRVERSRVVNGILVYDAVSPSGSVFTVNADEIEADLGKETEVDDEAERNSFESSYELSELAARKVREDRERDYERDEREAIEGEPPLRNTGGRQGAVQEDEVGKGKGKLAPRGKNDGSLFDEGDLDFNLDGGEVQDTVRIAAEKKAEEDRQAEAKRKLDAAPVLPGVDPVDNADNSSDGLQYQTIMESYFRGELSEKPEIPKGMNKGRAKNIENTAKWKVRGEFGKTSERPNRKDVRSILERRAWDILDKASIAERNKDNKAFAKANREGSEILNSLDDSDSEEYKRLWAILNYGMNNPVVERKAQVSKPKKFTSVYNGKEVESDSFQQAAQRVSDNLTGNDHGYVRSPNGQLHEVSRDKKTAVLVKEMRSKEQREIAQLEERIERSKYPNEKAALAKRIEELKKYESEKATPNVASATPNVSLKRGTKIATTRNADGVSYFGEVLQSNPDGTVKIRAFKEKTKGTIGAKGYGVDSKGNQVTKDVDVPAESVKSVDATADTSKLTDEERRKLKMAEAVDADNADNELRKGSVEAPKDLIDSFNSAKERKEQRKTDNGDVMFRRSYVTPEQDAEYLDSVERGDMETAQKMVDEAAKAAGYTVGPVWHSSSESFTKFRKRYERDGVASAQEASKIGRFGKGIFFSSDQLVSEKFGGVKRSFYLKIDEPTEYDLGGASYYDGTLYDQETGEVLLDDNGNPMKVDNDMLPDEMSEIQLDDSGARNTGVIVRGIYESIPSKGKPKPLADTYVVGNPAQIKSADPVTRDDQGNVIPLSQRFNDETPDIRFRRASSSASSTRKALRNMSLASAYVRAYPSDSPDGRRAQATIELAYDDSLTPKTLQEMGEAGKRSYDADPQAAELALLAGTTPSGKVDEDAKRMARDKVAVNVMTERAIASGDTKQASTAMLGVWRWYERGTEVARALRMRFDPMDTPEGRKQFVMRSLLAPTDTDIIRAKRAKDTQAQVEAMKPSAVKALATLKKLRSIMVADKATGKKHSLDFTAFTNEQLMDEELMNQVLVEIATDRAGWGDKIHEFWRNSILSGVPTQVVNTLGNAGNAALEAFVQRPVQAIINSFVGNPDAATKASILAMWKAIAPSYKKANANFIKAWVSENSVTGPRSSKLDDANSAIQGRKGKIIRMPQRLMTATDEWFKTIFMSMLTADYATRKFDVMLKDGKVRESERDAFLSESMQVGTDAYAKAWEDSLKWSFQQKNGVIAQGISRWRSDPNLGFFMKFILPFVKTPANIVSTGMRKSPFGIPNAAYRLVQAARGDGDVNQAIELGAEQLVGMIVMASIWGLTQGDDDDELNRPRLTGSKKAGGKYRPGMRESEMRDYPPTSIRIGDKWISYARLEPFATVLSTMADVMTAWEQGKDGRYGDIPMTAFNSLKANFRDKTFLSGIGDIIGIMEDGDEKEVVMSLQKIASGFMPNLVRTTVRAFDPYIRDYRNREEGKEWGKTFGKRFVQASIPAKEIAPVPRYDIKGKPVEREGGGVYNSISPFRVQSADRMTKVDAMLKRYNDAQKDDNDRWMPSVPAMPKVKMLGKKDYIKLTDEEYAEYQQIAGQFADTRLGRMRFNLANPTERDVDRVKAVYEESREYAKNRIRAKIISRYRRELIK